MIQSFLENGDFDPSVFQNQHLQQQFFNSGMMNLYQDPDINHDFLNQLHQQTLKDPSEFMTFFNKQMAKHKAKGFDLEKVHEKLQKKKQNFKNKIQKYNMYNNELKSKGPCKASFTDIRNFFIYTKYKDHPFVVDIPASFRKKTAEELKIQTITSRRTGERDHEVYTTICTCFPINIMYNDKRVKTFAKHGPTIICHKFAQVVRKPMKKKNIILTNESSKLLTDTQEISLYQSNTKVSYRNSLIAYDDKPKYIIDFEFNEIKSIKEYNYEGELLSVIVFHKKYEEVQHRELYCTKRTYNKGNLISKKVYYANKKVNIYLFDFAPNGNDHIKITQRIYIKFFVHEFDYVKKHEYDMVYIVNDMWENGTLNELYRSLGIIDQHHDSMFEKNHYVLYNKYGPCITKMKTMFEFEPYPFISRKFYSNTIEDFHVGRFFLNIKNFNCFFKKLSKNDNHEDYVKTLKKRNAGRYFKLINYII